jgi:integrase
MRKRERAETKKLKFTEGFLERLKAPAEGREIYYDANVPGLGVSVFPSGKRIFHWFASVHAKPVWKSLGTFSDFTLTDARAAAGEWNRKRDLWKSSGYTGPNPFTKEAKGLTLEGLKTAYIEQHLREHSVKPEKAERDLGYLFDKYLARWKDSTVDEITPEEIAKLHRKIGAKHQRMANVVVKQLGVMYRFAERAHLWKGEVPTKGIKLYFERKRSRYLSKDELPRLFKALSESPNLDLQHYVLLSLFCGTRKSDTLSMRWSDLDLDAARWTIPNPTKSREPRTVVLTPEAISVLKGRRKYKVVDNDFVFPGRAKSGHVVDMKKPWKQLLVNAGLYSGDSEVRVRQHDLRRSFAATMAMNGASLLVVAKALGHANSASVTELYARISDDVVREAMTASNAALRKAMHKRLPAGKLLPARATSV